MNYKNFVLRVLVEMGEERFENPLRPILIAAIARDGDKVFEEFCQVFEEEKKDRRFRRKPKEEKIREVASIVLYNIVQKEFEVRGGGAPLTDLREIIHWLEFAGFSPDALPADKGEIVKIYEKEFERYQQNLQRMKKEQAKRAEETRKREIKELQQKMLEALDKYSNNYHEINFIWVKPPILREERIYLKSAESKEYNFLSEKDAKPFLGRRGVFIKYTELRLACDVFVSYDVFAFLDWEQEGWVKWRENLAEFSFPKLIEKLKKYVEEGKFYKVTVDPNQRIVTFDPMDCHGNLGSTSEMGDLGTVITETW